MGDEVCIQLDFWRFRVNPETCRQAAMTCDQTVRPRANGGFLAK
jgi:hypothetical protein